MLLEFKLNRAIDLKKALTPLTSLAQTASIINSTNAVTMLATILDGDAIAVLRISSTEFVHFFCHEGDVAVFDLVMLYRYLHFFSNDNLPVTVGVVRVENDGGKLTATMPNIGLTPYTSLSMGLIQPNVEHMNFFYHKRKYHVKVGILTAKFRAVIEDMARRSVDSTTVVTIHRSHVTFNVTGVYNSVLRDLYECDIVGDTGNYPILLHFRVDHLVSIGKAISLSKMVWIYGSYSALPMLHFRVPPIGELSYYFV
ncbi:hypothetical protein LWI29_016843 [Acer saccharum]|uniref:Uncharacterized protein n=1 Tax=Acer saccharum TaxID=4024 RepID=A0AA39RYZ7_ACESA|nr:hypothetical protein LWI29_016843 [Acer saccharum]